MHERASEPGSTGVPVPHGRSVTCKRTVLALLLRGKAMERATIRFIRAGTSHSCFHLGYILTPAERYYVSGSISQGWSH